jgi:UDP-GlcNAc:undecaprenyl-phosphate/decaprenyl-phosphate GlcNAc-1-phosphate transferase
VKVPADLIVFGIALLASLGLTIPVRKLALKFGMVDRPGPRKVHVRPIPLLGGIAIYLGFVLAVLLAVQVAPQHQILAVLAGATLLAIVGLLDDGGLLHHQVKLFVGMPLAAIFLLVSGIRAQFFSVIFPGNVGGVLDVVLTVVWIVGITAAFSILDHMDGLCAGIAAVAALFFIIDAGFNGQTLVRTLGAAALGSALGFLRWNFNPAKIFMGDGGAMFLGFLMATLGLKIRPEGVQFPINWLVPILILGFPIFDTLLISVSRSRRGLLPFTSPGKDHTAHRLSNLGLGHRGAVLVAYGQAAVFGGLALLVPRLSPLEAYAVVGALAFYAFAAVFLLESAPYERQHKLEKSTSSLEKARTA